MLIDAATLRYLMSKYGPNAVAWAIHSHGKGKSIKAAFIIKVSARQP